MTEQEYYQSLLEKEMEDAMYISDSDFKGKKPIEIYRMGYENGKEDAIAELSHPIVDASQIFEELKEQNYEYGFVAGYLKGMKDLIGLWEYQANLPFEERKSPEECVAYLLNKLGEKNENKNNK